MVRYIQSFKEYKRKRMYPINPYHFGKVPIPAGGLYYYLEGNTLDSSGLGYHLTNYSGTYVASRKLGEQAVSLSGGSLRANSALSPGNTCSISMWINPSISPASGGWLFKMDGGFMPLEIVWSKDLANINTISCAMWNGNLGNYMSVLTAPITILNTWTHIVVTADRTASSGNTYKIYINGISVSLAYTNPGTMTGNFPIVQYTFGNNEYGSKPFSGLMDDLKYYGRILSPAEVTVLYNE
jgi:hypothetical protein